VYKEISLTSFKEESAYRVEFLMAILGSAVNLLVLWFLWTAIFNASASSVIKGFTLPMMITYISISTLLGLYNRSMLEYRIEEDVKTGFITLMLAKPISYPFYYLFREIGKIGFHMLTRGFPIILIALVFFGISLPSTPLFFLSAILGFFINFLIMFLTGLWSFWSSGNIWGIRFTRIVVSDMLSGAIIPLYLFPGWLNQIALSLPFQAIYSVPLLIYVGGVTGAELVQSLLTQVIWLAVLGAVTIFVWKRAERKTSSQGG
jgi:ABC-2 type transport system permease protein